MPLFCPAAQLQRYIVDNYTLPNVEFVHIQGELAGCASSLLLKKGLAVCISKSKYS